MPNRIRLTDIAVRALKYFDGQITYWDDTLPAFGVRVGNRSKAFIVVQSGGRRLKIGSYPQTSLQDARQAAKLLLASPAPRDHVCEWNVLFILRPWQARSARTSTGWSRVSMLQCKAGSAVPPKAAARRYN